MVDSCLTSEIFLDLFLDDSILSWVPNTGA